MEFIINGRCYHLALVLVHIFLQDSKACCSVLKEKGLKIVIYVDNILISACIELIDSRALTLLECLKSLSWIVKTEVFTCTFNKR